MSEISNYFNCNCCLFSQDLQAKHLDGCRLGIPEEERGFYINCNYNLDKPVSEKEPEFNIKHRDSVGCGNWTCAECANHSYSGHKKCWD
jgi:hypothetical protein